MKKTNILWAPVRVATLLDDGSSSVSEKSLKLILKPETKILKLNEKPHTLGEGIQDPFGSREKLDDYNYRLNRLAQEQNNEALVRDSIKSDLIERVPQLADSNFAEIADDEGSINEQDIVDLVFDGILLNPDLVNQKSEDPDNEVSSVARDVIGCFGVANQNYQRLAGHRALMQVRSNMARFRQQRLEAVDADTVDFAEQGSLLIELFSYFGVDTLRDLVTIIGSSTYSHNSTYIAGMTFFRLALPLLFNFGPLHLFFSKWSASLQNIFKILNHALSDASRMAMESVVRHAPFDSYRAAYRAAANPSGILDRMYAYIHRNRTSFFVSFSLSSFVLLAFRNKTYFMSFFKFLFNNTNNITNQVGNLISSHVVQPTNNKKKHRSFLKALWALIKEFSSSNK
jgi:hypothetical protein